MEHHKDLGSQQKLMLQKLSFEQYKGSYQRSGCLTNLETPEMIIKTCLEELDQKGYYSRDQELKVDAYLKSSQESGH